MDERFEIDRKVISNERQETESAIQILKLIPVFTTQSYTETIKIREN